MTDEPPVTASTIKDNGWRQGTVLPSELANDLREQGDFPSVLAETETVVGVVISQDCDVVHTSFTAEPYVEVLWGILLKPGNADQGLRWCRSVRKLQLLLRDAEKQGHEVVLEVSIHDRTRIDRKHLCKFSPNTSFRVERDELLELRHWITQRYSRAAWPDAFNSRIAPRRKEIHRLLKREAAAHLTGVFLLLLPKDKELPAGENYELVIKGVMRKKDYASESKRRAAATLVDELAATLDACEDIEVLEPFFDSEEGMTLADLRIMKRWCAFDDLTLRDSSASEIAADA